jgi:hypothetical protein
MGARLVTGLFGGWFGVFFEHVGFWGGKGVLTGGVGPAHREHGDDDAEDEEDYGGPGDWG